MIITLFTENIVIIVKVYILTGDQIFRKFTEYIKRPIIRAAAEVIKHIDMTIGGRPHSGKGWKDVLEKIRVWFRTQELYKRELNKRKLPARNHNKQQSVIDGTTPSIIIPEILPKNWKPDPEVRPFQHPFLPLIPRFVPRLCEGLGFAASPACFSGKVAHAEKTSRVFSRDKELKQKKGKYIARKQRSKNSQLKLEGHIKTI